MKISIDRKKVEAVRRMELLGIYPETIQQFEKHNLVSVRRTCLYGRSHLLQGTWQT